MDSGAHFYKCDFQVHTPRDVNWKGAGAATDEERRQYSLEFVATCRAKGLEAVAITDHHDLVFFEYIREAALNETDDLGNPLPTASRLVVFPGMELTLGIPCQALLLFDAEIPAQSLALALPALGITPSDREAEKHAEVTKLDLMSLESLYDALNKVEPLRGRFIVFPHVGDGGHKTLLRKDFEKHYTSMPCVGGYVDGALPVEPKAAGMRNITSGKDKNWGNKPLGLLQTSDSRSRDFADLGKHATWVKWARPTAEALRQACLARHSRISHTEPTLPSIHVTRVEVSNSKFLGPIALDFNPQYNAVIGGRGTGKSTILEYIRWALCDQPPSNTDGTNDDSADFQLRRQALIEGTLLPLEAVVDVFFLLNGVTHIVRRKATGELSLKIGGAEFQSCTEQNVRELLPVRAYSQKQLSAVGARIEELRRFVHAPILTELDALAERIVVLAADLRRAFESVIRLRTLESEIAAHELERRSLSEQIGALRASLNGLSDDDRETIERQGAYEAEQRVVQGLQRDASAAMEALKEAAAELERVPTSIESLNLRQNEDLLKGAHANLADWISGAKRLIDEQCDVFTDPVAGKALGGFFSGVATWEQRREAHMNEYAQAKAQAAAHEQTLGQIQGLESRLAEINEAADEKAQRLGRLEDPEGVFSGLRAEWKTLHKRRADALEEQCRRLTTVSRSRLRATLRRATDLAPLGRELKQILKGTKTRADRIDGLVEQVKVSADPFETWQGIVDEFLALAWERIEDEAVAVLPAVPRLDRAGFKQKEKVAIARQLQPTTGLDLLLFDLRDLPVFEYQVRDDDFLPFEKASPGQQATALLSILLLQDGPPLLVDQPEDDLNMKIINEIVATLWQAKTHRQVLFASHNANLVVNGDAELVVCCDYRTSSAESGGQIKLMGAIDLPEINVEITEVMEGGVLAFKLRQQKYGF